MRFIDIRQRSPEWHSWRRQGVSATSAAVIMKQNPDKTPWRLWAEMVGLVKPDDLSMIPQVRIAIMLEPHALAWFEENYGQTGLSVCGESSEYPVIRASFDGLLDNQDVLEVKILSDSNFHEVVRLREASYHYKLYWWQVQHQLAVSGGKKGYLLFYHTREVPLVLEVLRDETAISNLIIEELAFWNLVRDKKAPEKDIARDFFNPEGECLKDWVVHASDIRKIESELADIERRREELLQMKSVLQSSLVTLMGDHMLAEAEGVRVTRYFQAGPVSWKEVAKSLDPDPDFDESKYSTFRSKGSERSKITIDSDTPMSNATMSYLWGGDESNTDTIPFYL